MLKSLQAWPIRHAATIHPALLEWRRIHMLTWGTFGPVHLLTLAATAAMLPGLYLLLRRRSVRVQTLTLGLLSLSGVAAILFNLIAWDSPVEYLPLHLCSLTAIALPIAVFTRSRVLCNLLLLWSLGAVMALVVNTAQADYELLSWTFFFYYIPHTMQSIIPLLMFRLGLVQKDVRCIPSTLGVTVGAYTVVHLCNVLINRHMVLLGSPIRVNYMYSVAPVNPVLQLFWDVIPHPYWYIFLALPLITGYLALVYLPELRKVLASSRRMA